MTGAPESLSLPDIRLDAYRIDGIEQVLTPALAIYPEIVDANIRTTLGLLGGDANRWRPHVKTAKLGFVMKRLVEHGIANFKCSTSLELLTVCENGAADVVVAYPMVGANARRVRAITDQFPETGVSALVECPEQIEPWKGSRIGLLIDVNPGMDRTGIGQDRVDEIIGLARAIQSAGQFFRGLHYYDGHLSALALPEREAVAHKGYDQLMEIVAAFERADIPIEEIITAGTPAFPCTLSYATFNDAPFIHRASPGTIVYNDCSSLAQLPIDVAADSVAPRVGDALYLVPRHICPTVNNFDHALLVEDGEIIEVERVTARGREAPVLI